MPGYSSADYTAALTRRYLRQINEETRPARNASRVSSTSADATSESEGGSAIPLGPFAGPVEWMGKQFNEAKEPISTAGWILDLLSRPAYAVGATMRSAERNAENPNPVIGAAKALGPAQGYTFLNELITPQDREMPSDVLLEDWDTSAAGNGEQLARFGAGLALDIGLDPLTYVPGGVLKSGLGGVGRNVGRVAAKVAPKTAEALKPLAEGYAKLQPKVLDDTTRVYGDAERLAAEKAAGPVPRPPVDNRVPRTDSPVDNMNVPEPNNGASVTDNMLTPAGKKQNIAVPTAPKYATNEFKPPTEFGLGKSLVDGKFVPPATKANAAAAAVLDSDNPSMVERLLRHRKTGVESPFSQKLANLSVAQAKYNFGIEDVPTPYRKVEQAVEEAAPVATPNAPSLADTATSVLTKEQWAAKSDSIVTLAQVRNGKPIIMPIRRLIQQAKGTDPNKALRASELIDQGYAQYAASVAKQLEGGKRVVEGLAKQSARQIKAAARARDASRRAQYVRLEGPELEAYKASVRKMFAPDDAREILKYVRPESHKAAVEAALAKKIRVKIYEVIEIQPVKVENPLTQRLVDMMNTPNPAKGVEGGAPIVSQRIGKSSEANRFAQQVENVKQNIDTAGEQIQRANPAEAVSTGMQRVARGEGLDDETVWAATEALGPRGAQWSGRAPDFTFTSPRARAVKNNPQLLIGEAIIREGYHGRHQANMYRHLAGIASQRAGELGLKGIDRARFIAEGDNQAFRGVIQQLKDFETFLRANGIDPILSRQAREGWPLGLGDILDVLYHQLPRGVAHRGKNLVERRIFDEFGISPTRSKVVKAEQAASGIPYAPIRGTITTDSLVDAVRYVLQTIKPDWTDPERLLKSIEDALARGIDEKKFNAAARIEAVGEANGKILAGSEKLFDPAGTKVIGAKPIYASEKNAAAVVAEAKKTLTTPEVVQALLQRAHDNAAKRGMQEIGTVQALSQQAMSTIIDILHNRMASSADFVKAINHVDEVVEAAKPVLNDMPASPEAAAGAAKAVEDTLPEVISHADAAKAGAIEDVAQRYKNPEGLDRPAINSRTQKQFEEAVAKAVADIPAPYLMHGDHVTEVALTAGIMDKLVPFLLKGPRAFANHFENATLHDILVQGRSVGRLMQGAFRRDLSAMAKSTEYTAADIKQAFLHIQGRKPVEVLTDAERKAVGDLFPVNGAFFDADGVYGKFFSEGFDLKHLVAKFESDIYGVPEGMRFDLAKATVNGKVDAQKLAAQWKTWDIEDPLDFLARMEKIATSMATDMTIAQEAWRRASSMGLASMTRHKGMVQMALKPGDESLLGRYFPKGAWFDREVLREIEKMDDILKQSDSFKSGFGKWVNDYIDPLLNMWKSGMTVWNPGHHIRNLIGDNTLSFYADGVKNPKYAYRATGMLGLRKQYTGWDAWKALQGVNRQPMRRGAVVATSRNGLKFTEGEVFQGLMDRGTLPDFRAQEDLLEASAGAGSGIAKLQERMAIFDGRAKQRVGTVSELRDDHVRLTHALHILEHGKWNSVDEALDAVAAQVRKHHPDGTDLTGFERRYMRRIFPFYSWSRKAVPLVVEAMLLQPGRVLAFPKAQYNWAQSQGIDLASLSNPFPEDQLFPSYMGDNITGPMTETGEGNYYGISPGVPAVDILNDFTPNPINAENGSDFLRSLLRGPIGMLNPMIKSPVEALGGSSVSTGAEMQDMGEYFDSQIPGVAKVASISGYSPMGTLFNALPGGESGLDVQRSVERGNKGHGDVASWINYLLGLGVQNMSTPSGITQAEIELRDRIAREGR